MILQSIAATRESGGSASASPACEEGYAGMRPTRSSKPPRRFLFLLILVLALVAAACSGDDDAGGEDAGGETTTTAAADAGSDDGGDAGARNPGVDAPAVPRSAR